MRKSDCLVPPAANQLTNSPTPTSILGQACTFVYHWKLKLGCKIMILLNAYTKCVQDVTCNTLPQLAVFPYPTLDLFTNNTHIGVFIKKGKGIHMNPE